MKIRLIKQLSLVVIIMFTTIPFLWCQELLGILDGAIYSIDTQVGEFEKVSDINSNSDALETDLAYDVSECLFYSIVDRITDPKLVSLTLSGEINIIALISYQGQTVNTVEAIAYNPIDELIYISASINGADAWSEVILQVDKTSGECSFVSLVNNAGTLSDIDNMCFSNDALYFNDGVPADDRTNFYKIPISELSSGSTPELIASFEYQGGADLAYYNGNLFYHDLDLELVYFDINNNQLITVAQTHDATEFGGKRFSGMDIVPKYTLLEATINGAGQLCPGESVNLTIDGISPDYNVLWSTGDIGSEISVNQPDIYSASVLYESCVYYDTPEFILSESLSCGNDCLTQVNGLGIQIIRKSADAYVIRYSSKKRSSALELSELISLISTVQNERKDYRTDQQMIYWSADKLESLLLKLSIGSSLKI